MELFSNDQSQLSLLDSLYFSDSSSYIPFNFQEKTEDMNDEFCLPNDYYRQESIPRSSASSLTETISSSMPKSENCQWKKRKQRNVKGQCKRTKNCSSVKMEMEEKKPLTDYIHVRARRGQATDRHSLAERVRRERITEKMKTLQDLVPGCEKVTGKALILDEIINYVESLKIQVEFLSMKLASVNPIMYGQFALNFDEFTSIPECLESDPRLPSSIYQSSHIQSAGDNNTEMASSSTGVLYGQGTTAFPQVFN